MTSTERIDELRNEIHQLVAKAETGEQWAHICQLEVELNALCNGEEIEFAWQSTPAVWAAYRKGYCGCEDCMHRIPMGLGATKQDAAADLIEREAA